MIDLNSSSPSLSISPSRQFLFDAIVVGAGIIGLAHAALLARQGKRVLVLEREQRAIGASVRNFGMIWPIGQPLGPMRDMAMRSRDLWKEILDELGTWYEAKGSLHLAYADDELEVLREFVDLAQEEPEGPAIVSPEEASRMSPPIRQEGLRGAMYSPSELCVDPRLTASSLTRHLSERWDVTFRFGMSVTDIRSGIVKVGSEVFEADEVFVCVGPTPGDLFPELLWDRGVKLCKLQMMRARPKSPNYRIGPHLCAGLTLLHYNNFEPCPSLSWVRDRFASELPEYLENHIHLLVSQHGDGALTIGDSHEYGRSFAPFSDDRIDQLILDYLDTFLPCEEFEIVQRWQGFYPKHPTESFLVESPFPGVTVVNVLSGIGMTLSFGLADHVLKSEVRA